MLSALTSLVLAAEGDVNDKADLYPHWQELVVGALAFAILFFFMWKWVLPRMNTLLEERREKIQGEMERAEAARLAADGFRVESDDRNEKLGARIRHAELQKIPYMLIVGEREQATGSVSPRKRKAGDLGSRSLDEFSAALAGEVARRE